MGSARGSQPDLQCERAVARPREHALMRTAPCSLFLFPVPCSLFLVPCSFFPVPCSLFLFPVPCSLFFLPRSLFTVPSSLFSSSFFLPIPSSSFCLPSMESSPCMGSFAICHPIAVPQGSARSRPQNCHFAAFHAKCLALCLESVQSPVSRPSVRGTSTVPRRSPSPGAVPVPQGSARSRPQNSHFAAFHARCLAL